MAATRTGAHGYVRYTPSSPVFNLTKNNRYATQISFSQLEYTYNYILSVYLYSIISIKITSSKRSNGSTMSSFTLESYILKTCLRSMNCGLQSFCIHHLFMYIN